MSTCVQFLKAIGLFLLFSHMSFCFFMHIGRAQKSACFCRFFYLSAFSIYSFKQYVASVRHPLIMKRQKWMHILVVFLISMLFISICGPNTSDASETSSPTYTDSDLNKYRTPSDNSTTIISNTKKTITKKKRESSTDKEYWCMAGSNQIKRIDSAKERVQTAENTVTKRQEEVDHKPFDKKAKKRLADAQNNLLKEQKKLVKEEAAFSMLENRAYRSGIPIGWLRCNFDY